MRMRRRLGFLLPLLVATAAAALAGFLVYALAGLSPLWRQRVPDDSVLVGWSPAGTYLTTWSPKERTLALRRAADGALAHFLLHRFCQDSRVIVSDAASLVRPYFVFSPNERELVCQLADDPPGKLRTLDLATGSWLTERKIQPEKLASPLDPWYWPNPQFSADGQWLFCRSVSAKSVPCLLAFRAGESGPRWEWPAGRNFEFFALPGDEVLLDDEI